MKQFLTLLFAVVIGVNAQAFEIKNDANWQSAVNGTPEMSALTPEMAQLGLDEFLNLTPKKYREMTGQKLGVKKSLQLKAAQKLVKKQMKRNSGEPDIPKGLYIVLAIFGWAWIAMGIMDEWQGNDWWVNLLLYFLCFIPGLIHALTKIKKYYA